MRKSKLNDGHGGSASVVNIPVPTINSLERATTVTIVVEQIRLKIIAGEYPGGSALPEASLASEYGVSRGSVRTALQTLESEGIVVTFANGRKRVLGLTEKYLHDLYRTRILIECEAARQILGLGQVNFSELADMVARLQAAADFPPEIMRMERTRANMKCHRALIRLAKNRPLLQCWNTIEPMLGAFVKFNSDTLVPETHLDDYVVSHRKVLEMFLAGDRMVVEYLAYHSNEAACRDTLAGLAKKAAQRTRRWPGRQQGSAK